MHQFFSWNSTLNTAFCQQRKSKFAKSLPVKFLSILSCKSVSNFFKSAIKCKRIIICQNQFRGKNFPNKITTITKNKDHKLKLDNNFLWDAESSFSSATKMTIIFPRLDISLRLTPPVFGNAWNRSAFTHFSRSASSSFSSKEPSKKSKFS